MRLKHYAIELRRSPDGHGWQWEVWLADELCMVAEGWMATKTEARSAARIHASWLESRKKVKVA